MSNPKLRLGYTNANTYLTLKRIFNVKDYGAIGDGVTDDTSSIQSAINECATAGGGTVYFPNGIYIISGSLITSLNSVNPNCQLYIPLQNAATIASSLCVIKLQGETPPTTYFNHLETSADVPLTGVILKSTIIGSGTRPAILGSPWIASPFSGYDADFNFCKVIVEAITFRVRSITTGTHVAPTMTALNLYRFFMAEVYDVRCDTESRILDQSVLPTSSQCIGIRMPRWNNSGNSVAERVLIQCYYSGIVVDECFRGDNLFVGACVQNLNIGGAEGVAANYPVVINRIFSHAGITSIAVTSALKYYIEAYNEEDYQGFRGATWFNGVADIAISGTGTSSSGYIITAAVGVAGSGARLFINSSPTTLKIFKDLTSQFDSGDLDKTTEKAPRKISNLVCWYNFPNFKKYSNGAIYQFDDISGSDYHATEATNRPTFTLAGQNNHPYSVFDGVNDLESRTALSEFKNVSALTWILVSKKGCVCQDNGVSTARTCIAWGTNMYFIVSNAGTSYGSFVEAATSPAIFTMVFDGSLSGNSNRLKAYKNGTQQNLSFTGTIPATTENSSTLLKIGKDDAGTFYVGDIYEFISFDKALNSTELATIHSYLKTKYMF